VRISGRIVEIDQGGDDTELDGLGRRGELSLAASAAQLMDLFKQRPGLAIAPLALIENSWVVEAVNGIGVGVAEHLPAKVQGLLNQRLGLAVAPLVKIETGQVVEALKGIGVGVAQHLAAELESLLK
jgi:hypothetical protein